VANKNKKGARKWYAVDLHIHTPASSDYQEKKVEFLEILRQAEVKGLSVIAITDHNTVAGYRKLNSEIEQLRTLKQLKRILPEEESKLKDFEKLLEKVLVLPGFEFTATFGFHILGIFPPEKSIREIEYLLLELQVPSDVLDDGSATIGSSSDVLKAYQVISDAGGMAIAAHANSNNGIAMRGFPIGGQTKISYTQDPNLLALEVTDLEKYGSRTTASFFNGSKPQYPRRMHCIQGSDAHRIKTDTKRVKNLGVGDRVTEFLLSEPSFEKIKEVLESKEFNRTRPKKHVSGKPEFDFIKKAREEGSNIIQDFHENYSIRGGYLYSIIADICAFANANGGTLYIGVNSDSSKSIVGLSSIKQATAQIQKEISHKINPPLDCSLDSHKTDGKSVLRITVPRGDDPPYAVDDNKIYVRDESETGLAVRDEIVSLVSRGMSIEDLDVSVKTVDPKLVKTGLSRPHTGVEINKQDEREGVTYYIVHDLRNDKKVKNVTVKSARRLWHYAIVNYQKIMQEDASIKIDWKGDVGIVKKYGGSSKKQRYDLALKENGFIRYYFGVNDDGLNEEWRKLLGLEE